MKASEPAYSRVHVAALNTKTSTKIVFATGLACLASATAVFASASQHPALPRSAESSNVSKATISAKHVSEQTHTVPDQAVAPEQSKKSAPLKPIVQVNVNGTAIPVPANGEVNKTTIIHGDGNTSLNVSINSSSSQSNNSDSSLELTVDSSSETSSGG